MKIKRIIKTILTSNSNTLENNPNDLNDGSEHDIYQFVGFLIVLGMLLLYIVVGSCMEHMACKVGHETGAIILIGMAVSLIIVTILDKDQY